MQVEILIRFCVLLVFLAIDFQPLEVVAVLATRITYIKINLKTWWINLPFARSRSHTLLKKLISNFMLGM